MGRKFSKYPFYYSNIFLFIFFAVTFLLLSSINSLAATQYSFEWDPNSEPDLAGYRVFYREEGQSYDFGFPDWEGTETTCTIYDLDENTTYYFVARAYDIDGNESGNSIELSTAGADGTIITTRDDAGGTIITTSDGSSGSGCFIATAAYGSLVEPHVKILRDFRDKCLLDNALGKGFIKAYYRYSPPIADFISKHDNLRVLVRLGLLPVVGISWVALKIGPAFTVALMLLLVSCFIGIVCLRRRYDE